MTMVSTTLYHQPTSLSMWDMKKIINVPPDPDKSESDLLRNTKYNNHTKIANILADGLVYLLCWPYRSIHNFDFLITPKKPPCKLLKMSQVLHSCPASCNAVTNQSLSIVMHNIYFFILWVSSFTNIWVYGIWGW